MGALDYMSKTRLILKKPGKVIAFDCEEDVADCICEFLTDVEGVEASTPSWRDREARTAVSRQDILEKQLLIAQEKYDEFQHAIARRASQPWYRRIFG